MSCPARSDQKLRSFVCHRIMDKYTLEEKIGEGSYAIVYRARKSGKTYAIKALKDDFNRYVALADISWRELVNSHTRSAQFCGSQETARSCIFGWLA